MKHSLHGEPGSRALMEKPPLAVVARPDSPPRAAAPEPESARQARIQAAAYALYEARGCVPGHDVEDWLAAEAALADEGAGAGRPAEDPH